MRYKNESRNSSRRDGFQINDHEISERDNIKQQISNTRYQRVLDKLQKEIDKICAVLNLSQSWMLQENNTD